MSTRSAKPRWLLLLAALTALLALAAAGCGGGDESTAETAAPPATETEAPAATTEEAPPATDTAAEPAPEPANLKVSLDWFANPDHVALFYAQEKGLWTDQALTVELKTPSDPFAGLKLVSTGKFDLAVYYQGDMFYAAQEGLPVIAVGSLVPVPLNSMISLADSPVQGPDTVKGASIGNAGLPFDDAVLQTIRQQQGLSEDEVTSVNVGFKLTPALLTGKVDAVIGAYWNIEAAEIEIKSGTAPTVTQLSDLGVPSYNELVIVANSERIASDPAYADAVSRFLAGMIAGTEGAIADPAGAAEILKATTEYSAEEIDKMTPLTLSVLTPPNGIPIGCFDVDAWSSFGQWMLDQKLLEKAVDATTIVTNDYNAAC